MKTATVKCKNCGWIYTVCDDTNDENWLSSIEKECPCGGQMEIMEDE